MATDAFSEEIGNNSLVRKWGSAIIAIQDYSEPVPETFFDTATRKPILPASAKRLGLVTTDGATASRSVSSTDTTMWQDPEPVRSDLESIVNTIAMAFGEGSNAYVQALNAGVEVANFPEKPDAPFIFGPDVDFTDFPYYRLWLVMRDGVGAQTRYRIEYAPKAKISTLGDRNFSRANPESLSVTFSAFKDSEAGGLPVWTMENSPIFLPAGG